MKKLRKPRTIPTNPNRMYASYWFAIYMGSYNVFMWMIDANHMVIAIFNAIMVIVVIFTPSKPPKPLDEGLRMMKLIEASMQNPNWNHDYTPGVLRHAIKDLEKNNGS